MSPSRKVFEFIAPAKERLASKIKCKSRGLPEQLQASQSPGLSDVKLQGCFCDLLGFAPVTKFPLLSIFESDPICRSCERYKGFRGQISCIGSCLNPESAPARRAKTSRTAATMHASPSVWRTRILTPVPRSLSAGAALWPQRTHPPVLIMFQNAGLSNA